MNNALFTVIYTVMYIDVSNYAFFWNTSGDKPCGPLQATLPLVCRARKVPSPSSPTPRGPRSVCERRRVEPPAASAWHVRCSDLPPQHRFVGINLWKLWIYARQPVEPVVTASTCPFSFRPLPRECPDSSVSVRVSFSEHTVALLWLTNG